MFAAVLSEILFHWVKTLSKDASQGHLPAKGICKSTDIVLEY